MVDKVRKDLGYLNNLNNFNGQCLFCMNCRLKYKVISFEANYFPKIYRNRLIEIMCPVLL